MNSSKSKRFISLALIIGVVSIVLVVVIVMTSLSSSCGKTHTAYDNENDPLAFSIQAVDKVFNPFFSSTGPDNSVVGMTQLSMLSNDEKGNVTYGDNEAVITKDLEIKSDGTEDGKTTYYFVLKNNIRFSDGVYLTIKDVLFNYYIYLDPAYTGSSTIYSTDIVGLKAYRTQSYNESEQENFNKQFSEAANGRISKLKTACEELIKKYSDLTVERLAGYLQEYTSKDGYENVVKDFNKTCELFLEELNTDYSNSVDTAKDFIFRDEDGTPHKDLLTTDQEAFLYNEGLITWNKTDGKLSAPFTDDLAEIKTWSNVQAGEKEEEAKERAKQRAVNLVYDNKMPDDIKEILTYWNTAYTLKEYLEKEAMEEFAKTNDRVVPNIEGIKFANKDMPVTVNGKTYAPVKYDGSGKVQSGNEVLSITINGVDPKAIWNFAIGVAPMHYYSSSNWKGKDYISSFDFTNNFGVEFMSQSFMNEVIKGGNKVGVPMGAGPYAASKEDGGIENITPDDFYKLGVIYYERNPYFCMGPAKIKKVRYQVVSTNQITNTLYNGEVDFAEPNAKPETISELNEKGVGNKSVRTLGYGYIGINAGKVPSLAVRQAIMYSINTQSCVDYYKTTASPIYRSMSLSSWAYPGYGNGQYGTKSPTCQYYPFIGGEIPKNISSANDVYKDYISECGIDYTRGGQKLSEDQQKEFIKRLVEGAGYTLNAEGIYQNGKDVLKYVFTIAGEETDHPAFNALFQSSQILNKCGFQITVTTDANALKKLSTGDLTVWAAAWGSTLDPDMYQVYHKESTATSVLNWGYKQILNDTSGKYTFEQGIIDELSEKIEEARKTNDQSKRARIYSDALDLVMELAVELPTYQRDDLFAYNQTKIDVSTFTPDSKLSSFMGLTNEMWNLSLVTER